MAKSAWHHISTHIAGVSRGVVTFILFWGLLLVAGGPLVSAGNQPYLERDGAQPAAPAAPALSASKTDALAADVDLDGRADPGDVLTYTVVITNSGTMAATGVVFSDTIDANTTLSGTVHVSPIAFADSYMATGNVGITVPAGSGLLANDVDPDDDSGTLAVVAFDATGSQGGTVSVAADGSFTYDPAAGFTGVDTFTYTLSDGDPVTPHDVETVTVTVSELVWFIDNAQGAGDGRLSAPFNTLAAFAAANGSGGNNPGAGDCIFLYETGSGAYTGGVTLENNQVLLGQGATESIASVCGLTLPPFGNSLPATGGTRPAVTNTPGTGHAITLAAGNTLRGLNVGDTDTGFGLAGVNVGTATAGEMLISGSGGLLDIDGGTLAMTFDSLTSGSSSAEGIDLDGVGGSLIVNGAVNISNAVNAGIDISGAGATVTFSSVGIDGTGGAGIALTNNSGAVSVNGGAIGAADDPAGNGVDIDQGSAEITIAATITNTTARAVEVTNRTGGTVAFSGFIDEDGTGILLDNNTGATINFAGGMALDTGSGTAFAATNGGTLNVTGVNTIGGTAPLNKTAVNISDTTIGAGAVTFQAIYNDQGATGSDVPAIILNNTGSGAFGVTGVGSTAGSGGTIEQILADAVTLNNTGGLVTFKNLIISDIGSTSGGFNTRSQHDGIHGQQVDGGLVLDNVTIRRVSDMAVNGALFADGVSATTWNGLQISNSTFQYSNRYHVSGTGDTSDEGMIRIVGIGGTVTIDNSLFEHGGELIDFFVTGGTLSLTATDSTFNYTYKEFSTGTTASIGKICIDVTVQGSAAADVTIGDRTDTTVGHQANDGGNDFLNCRIASIRVANDAGASGAITAVTANNTIVVDDHSSGSGGDFDFPMGGVKYSTRGTNSATFDGIIERNYFDEVTNADGGVGQVTLDMDGGQSQVRVSHNTFDTPGNAPWYVRGDNAGNVGAMNLTLLLENNTYIRGFFSCPDPSCGGGYYGPGLRSLVQVQDGGDVDVTLNQETLAQHDVSYDPGNTVEFQALNVGAAPTLCVNLRNNASPHGYALEQSAGTLNLEQGASSSNVPATVVADNGNTGGGGNPASFPPTVSTFGTINVVTTPCAQPGGSIFAAVRSPAGTGVAQLAPGAGPPVSGALPPDLVSSGKQSVRVEMPAVAAPVERAQRISQADRPAAAPAPESVLSGEQLGVALNTLEPNQTVTIVFLAAVDDPLGSAATEVCNQAIVQSNELADVLSDDPDTGPAADPTCTPLDLEADLVVAKTESVDPAVPGAGAGNLTYAITVTNQGPDPATSITVNEALTLPAGVSLEGVAVSTGSFADPVWTIPTLAVGASARMTVTLTVATDAPAGTDLVGNTATITGADVTLINTGDDSAAEATSIDDETRCGLTAGTHTFNQTTRPVTITVNTPGTLDCLTIVPTDGDHPNATTGIAGSSDLYWAISATGSGFDVDVTFPDDTLTGTPAEYKTCRTDDDGSNWDCRPDADGNPNTITRLNVTAFSDWQNCAGCGPTAVSVRENVAGSRGSGAAWLLGVFLALVTAGVLWRRRGPIFVDLVEEPAGEQQ